MDNTTATISPILLGAIFSLLVGLLVAILWEVIKSPRIKLEGVKFQKSDDFTIHLRNKGWKEASECIVTLEVCPLSEAKNFLHKFIQPAGKRVESYFLEEVEEPILYSCWPITRDVILPDMTDMKPGPMYDFKGRMPDFLREKKNLKEGDWNKVITFPENPGIYVGVITVYDGVDIDFVGIYEYLEPNSQPRWSSIGSIGKPRCLRVYWIYWIRIRLFLAAQRLVQWLRQFPNKYLKKR